MPLNVLRRAVNLVYNTERRGVAGASDGVQGDALIACDTVPAGNGLEAVMASPTRITVIATFQLFPHRRDMWHAAWTELERMALGLPTCHVFRLLRDPHDPLHCAAVSEWDDAASFNRFVRESHLLWIERGAAYARLPTEFTLFEDAHQEGRSYPLATVVERVMRPVAHR